MAPEQLTASAVDACLQKALAKTLSDRYPSAAAMRAELIPAIRRYPERAT
jgi:hypothetical protein